MKKWIPALIASAFICGGCSVSSYRTVRYTDYTRYMKQSFYVSTLPDYSGYPYTALGDIAMEYAMPDRTAGGRAESKKSQKMLTMLVKEAKSKGANGLMNVKVSYHPATGRGGRGRWVASGTAVYFETLPPTPQGVKNR